MKKIEKTKIIFYYFESKFLTAFLNSLLVKIGKILLNISNISNFNKGEGRGQTAKVP